MTTLQLAIVCVTVLAAIVIVTTTRSRSSEDHDKRTAFAAAQFQAAADQFAAATAQLAPAIASLEISASATRGLANQLAHAPTRVGNRITINTKQPDDQTVAGVCVADYVDRISLEHAEYIRPGGNVTPIPGRYDIDKINISLVGVHDLVDAGAEPRD